MVVIPLPNKDLTSGIPCSSLNFPPMSLGVSPSFESFTINEDKSEVLDIHEGELFA
jgi:hypothetical protein